jgi:hypothetical protein
MPPSWKEYPRLLPDVQKRDSMHLFLHQMNSIATNMNIKYRIYVYHASTSSQVCQYPKLIQVVYNPSITTQNYIYIFFQQVELSWLISDWRGKLWTGNSKYWQFWLHVCIFTFSILQVLEGSDRMYTDQEIRMRFFPWFSIITNAQQS